MLQEICTTRAGKMGQVPQAQMMTLHLTESPLNFHFAMDYKLHTNQENQLFIF
jgi:hypothetical protein